jgi:thiol-disulfide isomerase/thioredoxin
MVEKSKKSVDVRSKKDVAELEHDIKIGPITIVLVYADWCGHCVNFMENVWKKLLAKLLSKSHNVNLASVHHDQLAHTSLRDAKIRGYPSVLVVGKDGKPATFHAEGQETNAMPNPDLQTLEKIVNADVNTIMQDKEEGPKVLSPPDVRKDIIGGGNLLKTMMRYASGKTRKAAKKGNKGKKVKRTRHRN